MRTEPNNKRKQQTRATNATTNGGDASRVGKRCSYYFVACVFPLLSLFRRGDEAAEKFSDARRVAPISGSV